MRVRDRKPPHRRARRRDFRAVTFLTNSADSITMESTCHVHDGIFLDADGRAHKVSTVMRAKMHAMESRRSMHSIANS